jgi:hypothetical protein
MWILIAVAVLSAVAGSLWVNLLTPRRGSRPAPPRVRPARSQHRGGLLLNIQPGFMPPPHKPRKLTGAGLDECYTGYRELYEATGDPVYLNLMLGYVREG